MTRTAPTEAEIVAYMVAHMTSRGMALMALDPEYRSRVEAAHHRGAKRTFDDIMVDLGCSV